MNRTKNLRTLLTIFFSNIIPGILTCICLQKKVGNNSISVKNRRKRQTGGQTGRQKGGRQRGR